MSNRLAPVSPQWQHLGYYVGFDWARRSHCAVVLDPDGKVRAEVRFDHDGAGWSRFRGKLQELAGSDLSTVGVAIETRCGPAVEKLLELGCSVFALQPKAAQRYRDRKAPSGTKDDVLDAWAFGDALRTDGRAWKPLHPEDSLTQELRLVCRDQAGLIEHRTALVNELQQALYEYYPAAVQAFDDWTQPSAWAFIERFETPQRLAKAGKRGWDKFLHSHRLYRPQTYDSRIEIFSGAQAFCGSEAVTRAKSLLALSLARRLRALQREIDAYGEQITQLLNQHPQREVFESLPGAGRVLAPRLLSECSDLKHRFDDAEGLRCYAGTAPVQYQSGQIHRVRLRRSCNKHLRQAVHLWANCSRRKCAWAQAYYQQKRAEGKSHACAVRCLGQRWLKILWKMLLTNQPYDEALHTRNQVRHGSWVLSLQT